MSYTTAHASNFLTSAHATAAGTGASTPMLPTATPPVPPALDRRQVVPIDSAGITSTGAAPPPPPPPRPAAAYTANLEAQVRVLEHEVLLLRGGLAQNERLRQVAGLGTPAPAQTTAAQKRVRFGPASVVHLSPTRQPARTRATHPAMPRSNTRSSSSSSSGGGGGVVGADGRPRLAFGQRVDPTQPRQPASASPPTATTTHDSSAAPSAGAAAASPATTASVVELSPAPASLRGSNTNGIPLQGTGVGGTLVAPLDAAVTTTAAPAAGATVWAAADPSHRLWSRTAAMASADLARYPFRATAPTTASALPRATPQDVRAASPPPPVVVVAMSSDGPPRAPPPPPPQATSVAAAVTEVPATALPVPAPVPSVAAAALPLPALTVSLPPPSLPPTAAPTASTTTTVSAVPQPEPHEPQSHRALEAELCVLRDTLAQREALLHRLLLELHDRSSSGGMGTTGPAALPRTSPLRRGSHTATTVAAAAAVEEQSRRALRLLAEELLAAQTQLSQARTSYQLIVAELQACRQQREAAAAPAAPPPQAAAASAAPTVAAPTAAAPASASNAVLQAQLDVAHKKLKAWEDWYASTASTTAGTTTHAEVVAEAAASVPVPEKAENVNSGAAAAAPPQDAPQQQQQEQQQPQQDQERHRHHHRHRRSRSRPEEKDDAAAYASPSSWGWPSAQGGHSSAAAGAAAAVNGSSVSGAPGLSPLPAFHSFGIPTPGPALATAASARPYTSAFAMDTALYHLLAHPRDAGAGGPSPPHPRSAPAASTPTPPVSSQKTAESPAGGTQPQAASPPWTVPWGGAGGGGGGGGGGADVLGRACNPYGATSPYCDRLDHAQQQAYRSQVYVTQLAREAAVRELAEAERLVAEQRLTMWEQQHQQQQQQQGRENGSAGAAGVPSASTPDGAPRAETVE